MDAELRSKWIAALRSGDFKQGEGQLRSADRIKHCCLGVLCVVAGIPITEDGERVDTDTGAGYDEIHEIIGGGEIAQTLYRKNDSGSSFADIADYIERNIALSSDHTTKS